MKTKSLSIFTFLLILGTGLTAQVTIGSHVEPNSGALLDIKETNEIGANSHRGFMLPRVNLSELNQLYPMFSDDGNGNYLLDSETRVKADEDIAHTGLTVYNLSTDFCKEIYPGPYTWDGQQWVQILGGTFPSETSTLVDTRDPSNPVIYPIGKFGNAGWWMLSDLRAEIWPDGTSDNIEKTIPVYDPNSYKPRFYYANLDEDRFLNNPNHGYMYSFNAAARTSTPGQNASPATAGQGICPDGWHLPTRQDWMNLNNEIYYYPCKYAHSTINFNVGYNAQSMTETPNGVSRSVEQGGFNAVLQGLIEYGVATSTGGIEGPRNWWFGERAMYWMSDDHYYFVFIKDIPQAAVYSSNFAWAPVRCMKDQTIKSASNLPNVEIKVLTDPKYE